MLRIKGLSSMYNQKLIGTVDFSEIFSCSFARAILKA